MKTRLEWFTMYLEDETAEGDFQDWLVAKLNESMVIIANFIEV